MATRLSGSCLCGAVHYECTAEPVFSVNCHCRDCQRVTGSAFAALLYVPRLTVTITGAVHSYDVTGESGNVVSRGFCPTCGARLLTKAAIAPDLIGIMAGSLEDPSEFRPAMDIYTASAQPWDQMNAALPKFERGLTEDQLKEVLTARG
jgi:hypothetical protein